MNPDHDKLLAEFQKAIKDASNAAFDCGNFRFDYGEPEQYDALLLESGHAKAKLRALFEAQIQPPWQCP